MDLKELEILQGGVSEHWYYRAKAQLMLLLLQGVNLTSILDVGAGSAFFSKHLLNHSEAVEAWCVDTSYGSDLNSIENEKKIHFRREVGALNSNIVLLMDVLEHVENDVGLLKEYVNKVSVGTTFLITVPAFQFLWSGHDVFLGHKRRYTLRQIEDVVAKAGLNIVQSNYYFAAIFPLAIIVRLFSNYLNKENKENKSNLKKHNFFINTILYFVCRVELLAAKSNKFFGLSIFCMAIKK